MSYSKKYRERTIEYRQDGHTLEETHQIFKVSIATIRKWEKQWKETGDLGKKELHPDAYQSEMAQVFECSESGIRDALKRYKITRKKRQRDIRSRTSKK